MIKLCIYLIACFLPPLLPAQNLIQGIQFTDIRNNRILEMPVVNASQVEGYEILYATPGTGDIAEIAGHLLLRIHLKDVPEEQDLILSFLADTGNPPKLGNQNLTPSDCRKKNWFNLLQTPNSDNESPWSSIAQSLRGLGGGFPVTLDIQTFAYTLKSYTVEQDRNLLRYKLILSDEQRDHLTHTLIAFNDRPPIHYYFFHQNCGSVLVRVIGEGIHEKSIADFKPWVSPPHSLCALLVREGFAERISPDFYSTRAQGDLYRKWFRETYPAWVAESPTLPWPDIKNFLSADVETRVWAIQQLEAVLLADPNQNSRLMAAGPLLQQMELSTDVRSGLCRDLTSPATTAAREFQAELMQIFPDTIPENIFVNSHPLDPELSAFKGSDHTGLFALETGPVWLEGKAGWMLSGSLLQQQMGSRSKWAMQRAGELTLGRSSLVFDDDSLQEWQVTGLSLKKFRERQGQVSSGLLSTQGWGLGLSVLEVNKRSIGPDIKGQIAGISTWCNLLSSSTNRQYLIIGSGVDAGWSHGRLHDTDWGLSFPLQAESLLSAGTLQWRNHFAWIPNTIADTPIDMTFRSNIACPLGEWGKTEIILHGGVDIFWSGKQNRTLGTVYLEFNRW
ncbi:DUF4105 domain-containing protein [Kiritimatiellaeota bacterium B1221]|nr:DUF4105 domain-containing protein [Kiritimatiellaeota bacterium B1221]